MYKFLRYFFIICFLLIFFYPFFSIFVSYNPEESTGFNDYARITDVDYKAVLVDEDGEGGKVIITEQLTYDVHAASSNNLFWELWRDLPEDYVDGLKIDYQVNYVKQLNADGTETIYTESPKLYWDDSDYTSSIYGPGKWYHSEGPYNEDLRRYECIFFYVDGLYREKVTFEIQYEMNNAALRYSDVSELYLSMYSESTIKYLESFEGQILIPNKDMPHQGNYSAHTYGTNNHTFNYSESDTLNPGYHTFSFSLDEDDLQFKNYNQYLEFSLLAYNEDKHIFTDYAPSNYYSNEPYLEEALVAIKEYDELPIQAKKNKTIVLTISIITSIFILIFLRQRDKKIKKQHNLYEKTTKIKYFRDIPTDLDPYFAAKLVFSKDNHKVDMGDVYSALLLNLVRKGYIKLERIDNTKEWKQNNILLKILYHPSFTNPLEETTNSEPSIIETNIQNISTDISNSVKQINETEVDNNNTKKLEMLSANEETYFNLIVKYAVNDSISMEEFNQKVAKDYDNTDAFVTSIENSIVNIGISNGYFQKVNYAGLKKSTNKLANKYIILAIIIIIFGNLFISRTRLDLAYGALFILGLVLLIGAFFLKKVANKYVLLTEFGEEEYEKWRALYNFLNDMTLMKEKTVIELPLWEKYLVYATAFGIADKVIKALELYQPDVTNSPILSNNYYYSKSLRLSTHSFKRATNRASSISRTSRYSGGTYYGGGGRGGGGGGGGH